jgi:BirA family transcriptional regulator, biotin operon repressor / biotin---[acetyl-CoA-carboxylase] ligase
VVICRRLFVHPCTDQRVGDCICGAILIGHIERIAQTDSTNADLLARLANGETISEGHWLIADRQFAGRGRLGRKWDDGLGNFMGSTVVPLRANDPPPATLALVAGVALARAVGALGGDFSAQLKWPNDLLIDGAKCAGILMERCGDAVVIGTGVNLVSAPELPDRQTISLSDHALKVNRDHFAEVLAVAMADALWNWRQQGVGSIIADWLDLAHPIRTPLHLTEQNISGQFDGLADDGALRLRCDDGTIMLVHAGDVEMQRPTEKGNRCATRD